MGQEKQKRQRLGEWYGKPVTLGHPDYVAPVEAERHVAASRRPPAGVRTVLALMAMTGGAEIARKL